MVRAYVLIETTDDKTGAVAAAVGHGLRNCLALSHIFQNSEVMVHAHCTDIADLYEAITNDWPRLDGVKRITPCVIINE